MVSITLRLGVLLIKSKIKSKIAIIYHFMCFSQNSTPFTSKVKE